MLLGALFFASPVSAAPSAAEREAARKFMDEGTSRMKANDPIHALESFQKAHELMHVPTTGIAVAKAQLAAGHLVEAREAAVDVARTSKEPGEPVVFEKARKHAREIEAQVKGRIPTLRVHVRGGIPNRLAVDDAEIPLALISDPIPVNPGKHLITAKGSDGSEGKLEVELRESDKTEADLTLAPPKSDVKTAEKVPEKSATPPPSTTTPTEKPKILGFGNDDVTGRGARRTPLAEGLIYGGFGIGGIGVVVGAITGVMTLGKASSVKTQCENNICAPTAKDGLASANTLATLSTIGFAVGIGGIGAGIIGLVMPPAVSAKTRGGLEIHPTANGLGGTF